MTGRLLRGVRHAVYHLDEVDSWLAVQGGIGSVERYVPRAPRLSRSIAAKLLNESPLHAWAAHPRLGGGVDDATRESDGGSLLHQLLLGEGPEVEVVYVHTNKNRIGPRVPAESFRTAEAQEIRDAAIAAGKIPVLERLYEQQLATVESLRNQLDDATDGSFSDSESEVTALWEEEGVACKARLDKLHLGRGLILDPKFVGNAHPEAFGRSMVRSGYDLQQAVYIRAVEAAHPALAGRLDFQFLLVEVDRACVPIRHGGRFVISLPVVGGTMRSLGELRWRRAMDRWRECLASGVWPAYDCSAPIEARPWDLTGEMDHQISQAGEPSWMTEGA